MEKKINLPTTEAVREFVRSSEESGDTILVTREGFTYQIDGASLLGMMTIIGQNILVKCIGNSASMGPMLDKYAVV